MLVLSLEHFKTGPIDKFRSITKDFIFKGSYIISIPFVIIKQNYYNFQDHMTMFGEYENLKNKDLNLESLKNENKFFKEENNS